MILVGTTAGLVQVNAKTLEICSFVDFQGMWVSFLENVHLSLLGCVNPL